MDKWSMKYKKEKCWRWRHYNHLIEREWMTCFRKKPVCFCAWILYVHTTFFVHKHNFSLQTRFLTTNFSLQEMTDWWLCGRSWNNKQKLIGCIDFFKTKSYKTTGQDRVTQKSQGILVGVNCKELSALVNFAVPLSEKHGVILAKLVQTIWTVNLVILRISIRDNASM